MIVDPSAAEHGGEQQHNANRRAFEHTPRPQVAHE
jgi:hypothetical protein